MDGAKNKYDNQSDIYMRITFFFFNILLTTYFGKRKIPLIVVGISLQ